VRQVNGLYGFEPFRLDTRAKVLCRGEPRHPGRAGRLRAAARRSRPADLRALRQRDGRWCVVDLVGKKERFGSFPAGIDEGGDRQRGGRAGMSGPESRGVNNGDLFTENRHLSVE
jgi:hypothetical protein